MRRELKLAFDELEKELLVIPPDDLFRFMGGFSTGSSSGGSSGLSANASLEEVVGYLKDIGMEFTEDSSGNYYFKPNDSSGNSIRLEEVVVTGFYSTGSTGSWETGGTGASGFNSVLDKYVGYLSSYGHQFTGSNGNYSYTPPGYTPPLTIRDPWKRGLDNKIIGTKTGNTTYLDYGENEYTLYFDEVEIKSNDGMKSIKALEVTSVKDNKTGQFLTTIPDRFKSNCSGYAFTDGQYWIVDSYESTTRNEIADFENLLNSNSLYQKQIGSTNANVAVIWWTDKSTGERFIAHSAIVDGTNKYMQKSDYSMHGIATFEGFTDGHLPSDPSLYSYEIAYYKRNF